jgi:hypothetical protein
MDESIIEVELWKNELVRGGNRDRESESVDQLASKLIVSCTYLGSTEEWGRTL